MMSLVVSPATLVAEVPVDPSPRFVVGQDPQGCWVALEAHGLAGGLFRTCADAIHYAAGETQRRPDAVTLSSERIAFRT